MDAAHALHGEPASGSNALDDERDLILMRRELERPVVGTPWQQCHRVAGRVLPHPRGQGREAPGDDRVQLPFDTGRGVGFADLLEQVEQRLCLVRPIVALRAGEVRLLGRIRGHGDFSGGYRVGQ